ncbi:amino acid transporter AVT6E-like [Salvia miltiorrhiza]|uniref:amino acid transporter AVT6E-like n=1 Tax=Salvia miltiorrhiza TaxID=226208 RepID=UPI0025AC1478|nr:amino acid transporter AVT6E-like [Salvia miltiorrhiza]
MKTATFEWLCGLLELLLDCRDPVGPPLDLPAETRLGIGLFRLTTGSDHCEISARFGVSEAVSKFCVKQICCVLCTNYRFWVGFSGHAELNRKEMQTSFLCLFVLGSKKDPYLKSGRTALGRTARTLSEICIIVNNAGVLVVYLIIIGDVMSGSLHHMGVFDQWWGHGFWDHRKIVILIVLVLFLAPLCTLDKIDSLSTTSAASVALAIVFVVVVFIVALIKLVEGKIEPPRMMPDFGSKKAILDLLVVIPIMSNAYVCHFNVQPIYNELEGRSPSKMYRVGRITAAICVVVYASTAIAGYLLFGEDTESDVLTNFDKVSKLSYILFIIFKYL